MTRRGPYRIGRPFGVQVRLDLTWFLILALVGVASRSSFRTAYPLEEGSIVTAMAAAATLLFFASLLSHELAHAVLARRLGIPVRGITLFLFGGVSEISQEVRVPRDEFAIALVGPLVSVFLGAAFALVSAAGSAAHVAPIEGVAASLAGINGILALFNLVPGLPLDGGRLLRSGMWRLTGNRLLSTRVAVAGGRLAALALLVWGVVQVARRDVFGLWFAFVAMFLDAAARASGRAGDRAVAWDDHEGSPPESRS